MANVLLGVTGSVGAVKVPQLYDNLREAGHEVKVVATSASLYFFNPEELTSRDPAALIRDEDEWPGLAEGRRYRRGESVLHIELRRWADVFVIAPLDANTLAKLAAGLSDNCLTCVWRAWDPNRPIVLAPAMNTLMWHHPMTALHLRQLLNVFSDGASAPLIGHDTETILDLIGRTSRLLHVVPPATKQLACGDIGLGALADLHDIVAAVQTILSVHSAP